MVGVCAQVDLHSPDSIASVGILHPIRFHIEQKHGTQSALSDCSSGYQLSVHVSDVPDDWDHHATTATNSSNVLTHSSCDQHQVAAGVTCHVSSRCSNHHIHIIVQPEVSSPHCHLHWKLYCSLLVTRTCFDCFLL